MTDNTDINTYDEVPYESSPYANTHPAHLNTMGQIFGMSTVPVEKARILELGCASGGNIIPLALQYPKAEIVGIDLSKVQIDMANKVVKDLKLKNIKFHECSITDVGDKFGKFDYIIVHGILSWVPAEVQKKIFEVCGSVLTKQGIAYISYNTLPGWNMIKSIRDMMLYHSEMFSTVQEKVNQSRLLLKFVIDSLENNKTPYAEVLRNEAELLAKQPDYYLRHDHLEDNNTPFYFREFVASAATEGLQYLGDTSLASMYLGNMPAPVAEKLKDVQNIVRTEQYMDYINNRRFRMSLLCHADVKLNRALSPELVSKLHLSMIIDAETKESKTKLLDDSTVQFFLNNNKESHISTGSPALKAMFYAFAENKGRLIKFDALVKMVIKKLGKVDQKAVENLIATQAMKFMLSGHISARSSSIEFATTVSDKPKAFDMVSYQAAHIPIMWVTNAKHDRVAVNVFDKYALRYCDGKNDIEAILEKLFIHVEKGELTVKVKGKQVTDKKTVLPKLREALQQSLKNWVASALLVA